MPPTDPLTPEQSAQKPRIVLTSGARTDTGRLRVANEDFYGIGENVFVVADGLGGHNAGDVASQLAVSTILDHMAGGLAGAEQLGAAVQEANRVIHAAAASNPSLKGMATTVTALAPVTGEANLVAVANVGDSRTSIYRVGDFYRVSIDHSRVQELVDAGEIDPDKAWGHPDSNILTRAVGIEPMVEVDVFQFPVQHGDRFILCTDGLIDEVREEDIAEALWRHRDPQVCADALVDLANAAGGHDNITVMVVDVSIVPA